MDGNTYPYWMARPFFSALPAYVLTYRDEVGETCIATEKIEGGRAVLCFASPVDALIELLRFSQINEQYRIIPAQEVQQSAFRDVDGDGLIAKVHLGWPAIDGKLMLRADGSLGRYSQAMRYRLQGPPTFEFDTDVLTDLTRLHEAAGIFAWREALDRASECDPDHLAQIAAHAINSIEFIQGDPLRGQQIALFDPQGGQWRFLPVDPAK